MSQLTGLTRPSSEGEDGTLHFHETSQLSPQDMEHVQRISQRHVLRLFVRRRLIEDYAVIDTLTWQGAGDGGFSVNAAVRVGGRDRAAANDCCAPLTHATCVAWAPKCAGRAVHPLHRDRTAAAPNGP